MQVNIFYIFPALVYRNHIADILKYERSIKLKIVQHMIVVLKKKKKCSNKKNIMKNFNAEEVLELDKLS